MVHMEPIKDDGRLVALVTGGTSGIGQATARMLAVRGWHVVSVGLDTEESIPETQHIGRGELFTYEMDVTKPADITRILSALPRLDAIVHCAGFGIAGSAECTPMTLARKQFDVNYFGVLQVNEIALPLLRRTAARNRKRGRVIVVGSIGGRLGLPFQSHYSSTKAALEMYVEALRLEGRRHGITATIIEPGAHRRRQQLQGPDATQAFPTRSHSRIRHAPYLYETVIYEHGESLSIFLPYLTGKNKQHGRRHR